MITIFKTQCERFTLKHSMNSVSIYGVPLKYQKSNFVSKLKMP